MDQQLNYDTHINRLRKNAFYHLKNIAKLRPTLTLADAEKLVHAFVSSRLDYCNGLLIGISGRSIQKLQYIQNSAARILMRVRKYEHITPSSNPFIGCLSSFRIEFKVSLLTHQYMPPPTSRSSSPPRPPHAPFALHQHTPSDHRKPSSAPWAIGLSPLLPRDYGMPSLTT